MTIPTYDVQQADCLAWLAAQPEASCDLVFGSPPYMDARTYSRDDVSLGCEEWVRWMLNVTTAAVRVSRGLVLWVVAGVQRDNCYWPGCEGLAWEWWKRGSHLWCPAVWWKVDENEGGSGIPGSGCNVPGKRWLRKDWEYVLCFGKHGGIPYDYPENMGHAPVVAEVGGQMSNRTAEGQRINEREKRQTAWSAGKIACGNSRRTDGKKCGPGKIVNGEEDATPLMDAPAGINGDGTRKKNTLRPMPKVANPGNVLPLVVKARVGGGHMGSKLCHEGEAPFPEKLAEFFVLSFCPPGGIVVDCFSGSGTTAAVCKRHGRSFRGCDLRDSQVELTRRRLAAEPVGLFSGID